MKALLLNCSPHKSIDDQETEKLLQESTNILRKEEIDTERIHLRDLTLTLGTPADHTSTEDDFDFVLRKIKESQILILGSPVSVGEKSSIASLVLERLNEYQSVSTPRGESIFDNKVGGTIISGGGYDGTRLAAQSILYRLSVLGFTIPPHADALFDRCSDEYDNGDYYETEFIVNQVQRMSLNVLHAAQLFQYYPYPILQQSSE
ncbi:BRAMP protein [Pontibacillus halophilus JSM 076056 = DSM 19796]|uniref:BRAMP protein n=1 Tax=Pontibacillus halophilus JSM 076056 = DSM 19796 TaxID=1385510 RepID=A0A0A5GHX3_9BACI|nr:NAD(P)H-dependent oxidoreductase [Pontibacillus halophilus]KGX90720.1 BRAMP protein [Pontibacillus halophilus JSM 076056 = DSM 19796]